MKKLLIIGASGFVGRGIIDFTSKKKFRKFSIDTLYTISRKKIFNKINKSNLKKKSFKEDLLKVKNFPEVDYIIYCIRSNDLNKSLDYFNHFLFLISQLKRKPNLLFTSSGSVYGPKNLKKKISETEKVNLKNIYKFKNYKKKYSYEKILIERKFQKLTKYGYKVAIARLFTFFGKNILVYKYAISDLINNLNKGKNIYLKSSSDIYRSYMHSDDLSEWLLTIVKNSNISCPIFNVGSDKEIHLKSLVNYLAKKFNKKIVPEKYQNKKKDYYVPSIKLAKKKLKLKISIDLKNGINSIIKK